MSNFGNLMSEGFGQLASLKELYLEYCEKLELLPDSKSHSESFYFLFLMSEGFGQLSSLKELNLEECVTLVSLPESKSHSLKSFFLFLMSEGFGERWLDSACGRLRTAGQLGAEELHGCHQDGAASAEHHLRASASPGCEGSRPVWCKHGGPARRCCNSLLF